ncbi:MAG: glycosyltransferase [Mycobacteriaceae bacterium]
MTASKPIAVVTTTIPTTLNSFHRELVRQLQTDFTVHLVSSQGTELDEVSEELGAPAHVISMAREISLLTDALATMRWLGLLLRLRPALLISATPKASLVAQVAAWVTRVPRRVYFVGGLRLEGATGRARQLLVAMERLTFAASSVAVVNSPSLRRRAVQLRLAAPGKIRATVPGSSHGVDSAHFTPIPRDAQLAADLGLDPELPIVGFVGRLTHDKGIDALISAARLLEDRGTRAQWLVVGSQIEPDSMRYAERLRDAGSHVALVGGTRDVRPYFGLMDVHVLPSLREGFPNVVLEASAMEVPTVTTDATGAMDSVKPDVTGLIVPVGDGPALAAAVELLLKDDDRRRAMGRQARQWVSDEFVPTKVVASLLAAAR